MKEEGREGYPKVFTSTDGWMELPSTETEKAMGGTGFPTTQPAPLVPALGWERGEENMGGYPSQ